MKGGSIKPSALGTLWRSCWHIMARSAGAHGAAQQRRVKRSASAAASAAAAAISIARHIAAGVLAKKRHQRQRYWRWRYINASRRHAGASLAAARRWRRRMRRRKRLSSADQIGSMTLGGAYRIISGGSVSRGSSGGAYISIAAAA